MLRVGVTQRVEVLADRGERRDCLDQAWTRLVTRCGGLALPLPNCVDDVRALVEETRLDAVILTGGNDLAGSPDARTAAPERDLFETRLVDVCTERRLPVLGVCRGMQLLNAHYGGTVAAVSGHRATTHRIELVEALPPPAPACDVVNSYHEFAIRPDGVGAGLRVVAAAEDGTVEAFRHCVFPQWGVMWHPERPADDPAGVDLVRALLWGRER